MVNLTGEKSLNLRYNVLIKEIASSEENKDFMIQGDAIHECTTGNNHRFLKEELMPAANSLKGVPLLMDHRNEVECIKGRVTEAEYSEINKAIQFKAKVQDKIMQEMIKDGRLNSVSVGANVNKIEESDDGVLIPRGITFKELSLVAVPADDNANFGVSNSFELALKEAYELKIKNLVKEAVEEAKQESQSIDFIETERRSKMSEQIENKAEEKVDTSDNSKLIQESIQRGIVEGVQKALEAMPKPIVESHKGIEETQETDEKSEYSIEEGTGSIRGGSFTLIREYGKC